MSLDESLPKLTGRTLAGSDRLRVDSGIEGGDDGAYSDLYGSTVEGGIEGEQDLSGFSPNATSKSAKKKEQSPMSKLLSSRSFLVTVRSLPIDPRSIPIPAPSLHFSLRIPALALAGPSPILALY